MPRSLAPIFLPCRSPAYGDAEFPQGWAGLGLPRGVFSLGATAFALSHPEPVEQRPGGANPGSWDGAATGGPGRKSRPHAWVSLGSSEDLRAQSALG